ncbi:hypothetical protein [Salisaeta longa]|uniref:hypothetical protein n=1 Tax=Salisaeta longa TaxID=503170 RepID=UPI0003B4ED21|nr:hypothetical protein [Salisaeta longa]
MNKANTPLTYLLAGITALTTLGGTQQPQQHRQQTNAQHTHYVDEDAQGANNGNNWGDAYTSLQDALSEAEQTNGTDAIYVAEGTYTPDEGNNVELGDRTATFTVPSGVSIHGRFTGTETNPEDRLLARGANPTTLSGEIGGVGAADNSYTVVTLNGGTLDNVRVAHGNADGPDELRRGGGIDVESGHLHNVWVQQNQAEQGGGLYIDGTATLENVVVNENQAPEASGVLVTDGSSTISHLTLRDDMTIVDNDPMRTTDNTVVANSVLDGNVDVLTPKQNVIDFSLHEVGEDLYDTGDAPGTLEELRVTVGDDTYTTDMTDGSGTVTVPTTRLTDSLRVTMSDDDYISTWMLNRTGSEDAPDLTITGAARTEFAPEPDYQSNYDKNTRSPDFKNGTAGNATNGNENIEFPADNIDTSYEVRVIPKTSPEGYSVYGEYFPHLNGGRTKRWTSLEGLDEDKVYLYDAGQSQAFFDRARKAYADIRKIIPVPTSDAKRLTFDPLEQIYEDRNNALITRIEEGPPGNGVRPRGRFIENSTASFSTSSGQATFLSEIYSSFTGYDTAFRNGVQYEPNDTLFEFTPQGEPYFNNDAEFMVRITYSTFSASKLGRRSESPFFFRSSGSAHPVRR